MKTGYPLAVLFACVFLGPGCSSSPPPAAPRKISAANGGPEDGAILGVEALGGTCFRLFQVKEAGVPGYEFDVDADNPLAYVRLDHCPLVPGEVLRLLGGCRHLQKLEICYCKVATPRR